MKNVIFDFGNVIIQWRPYRALNGIFTTEAEMDQTLDDIGFFDWNLKQDQGRSWEEAVAVAERDTPEHAHIFRTYAEGLHAAHNKLVPGTSDLVKALHDNGVPLFGLTNAAQTSYRVVRSVAPVINLMRDVVVSADEGIAKPDPKIFEICLERNALDRSETMFVDDSLANCEAADKIGITAHHFTDAIGLEHDLKSCGLL